MGRIGGVFALVDHRAPHEKTAAELWADVDRLIEKGWYQSAEVQADNATSKSPATQEQLQRYVTCAQGNVNAAEEGMKKDALTMAAHACSEQAKAEARARIEFDAGHIRTDVVRPLSKARLAGYTVNCAARVIAWAEMVLGETKPKSQAARTKSLATEITGAIGTAGSGKK
jgi:hypothetical protein